MTLKTYCLFDEVLPVDDLKPHPKNRNKHPRGQIERLAKLIKYQGVRAPIVVSRRSGFIVKGHGTAKAIKKAGGREAPVVFQDFDSEEQEYAFVQSDNAIATWAELDLSGINADIPELGPDFDLDMLGLKDFKLDLSEAGVDGVYTSKIQSPIYEPKGPKPKIADLFDRSKTVELLKEIEASDLSEDLKEFLRLAAARHIVFNYEAIAEFYAHSEKGSQILIENSALVIIDFNKAIEKGFVVLAEKLGGAYSNVE